METGEVLTETTTKGVVDRPEIFHVGKRDSGSMEELGPKMTEAFSVLEKLSEDGDLGAPAAVAAIYNDSDMVNDRFDFTIAFFYDAKPAERDGFEVGSIPEHRGSYRHLGNGLAASMGCARAKHKINKALPAYEVYANNPGEVKEKDLLTEIYVPVKN